MPTLMQIVERQREIGKLIPEESISIKNLQLLFSPEPLDSMRALQEKMYLDWKEDTNTKNYPWAIVLCRFKDFRNDKLENEIKSFFEERFMGTGGLVKYWRDASLGAIDITGSYVFDWVELDIRREECGWERGPNIAKGFEAAERSGIDIKTGFHNQMFVVPYNWNKDCPICGSSDWYIIVKCKSCGWIHRGSWWDTKCDNCKKETLIVECYCSKCNHQDNTVIAFDGGAAGHVFVPPFGFNLDFLAHEMGHGFGLNHDFHPDFKSEYGDPNCIMSVSGPLCLLHLMLNGWMYKHRVYAEGVSWKGQPDGISLKLAPITDPNIRVPLGIKLAYEESGADPWDYYIEYVRPTIWKQVLPCVMVRRIINSRLGKSPAFLISIPVPNPGDKPGVRTEPNGNVQFQVELADPDGKTVTVTAKKL